MSWLRIVTLLAATSLLVVPSPASGQQTAGIDERFGVIVDGSTAEGLAAYSRVDDVLTTSGLRTWYSFTPGATSTVPGAEQIEMARPPTTPAALAARAQRHSGAWWLMGNEPNVPTQDNLGPVAYATWYRESTSAIRAVDPRARFIAPNGLNWDATCTACLGYVNSHDWSDQFLDTYIASYGEVPPIDVWGMHVYDLDWTNVPLVNATRGMAQIEGGRAWLESRPEMAGKPIWLTEFGVIFGFESFELRDVNGQQMALPIGDRQQAAIDIYINDTMTWLTTRGIELGVQRWYLFSALPMTEPYLTAYGGSSLLLGPSAGLTLSEEGRVYMSYASP